MYKRSKTISKKRPDTSEPALLMINSKPSKRCIPDMHKTLSRPSPINRVGNPHEGRFSINQEVPIYKKKKVKGLIKFQMERGRDDNMYRVNITPSTLNEDWKIVKPSKLMTSESQRVGVPFEK